MKAHRTAAVTCALALAVGAVPASGAPSTPPYRNAISTPVDDPYYPAKGDPRVDTLHYGLDLRWAPASRTLTGTATIRFRAVVDTRVIQLDFSRALHADRVRLDGRRVSVTHPDNLLRVQTGPLSRNSRHTLQIGYSGSPTPIAAPTTRADIPSLGWRTAKDGTAATMQEPFGALTWYPVNDHPSDKAFYDARINVPARWVGIFNGQLTRRATSHGRTRTRWHLASPAASYLITIAIGDYTGHRDRGPHGLPVTYWIPRGHRELLSPLRETPAMIRWLESRLGRYPFDRFGAVVVPSPSAMETQTLVTLGRGIYARSDLRGVILHELAHQWYGDTVTPDNWTDLWLNESFAMYLQARWESEQGLGSFRNQISFWELTDQSSRRADGPPGAYHRREFGSGCVYYCGAVMLNELRKRVGNHTFGAALRAWVQQGRDSNANRDDYVRFINAFTGQRLGGFLKKWLVSEKSPLG